MILKIRSKNVLIKGGHLEGEATDILYDGENFILFNEERINTKHTHGTGCTLSSAITANLSKGMNIVDSVRCGKEYITGAIKMGLNLERVLDQHSISINFTRRNKNGSFKKRKSFNTYDN